MDMVLGLISTLVGVAFLMAGINFNKKWVWWSGLNVMLFGLLLTGVAIIPLPPVS